MTALDGVPGAARVEGPDEGVSMGRRVCRRDILRALNLYWLAGDKRPSNVLFVLLRNGWLEKVDWAHNGAQTTKSVHCSISHSLKCNE